jgi:hypothetical protein
VFINIALSSASFEAGRCPTFEKTRCCQTSASGPPGFARISFRFEDWIAERSFNLLANEFSLLTIDVF